MSNLQDAIGLMIGVFNENAGPDKRLNKGELRTLFMKEFKELVPRDVATSRSLQTPPAETCISITASPPPNSRSDMALVRIACLFLLLAGLSLQIDSKSEGKEPRNYAEDRPWMSPHHGRKTRHWDRFRDQEVEGDDIKHTEDGANADQTDSTKDPCVRVRCSRHKVCVSQGLQRAVCLSRGKLDQRVKKPESPVKCRACTSSSAPVCGSDGHSYASECKLQQQSCLTGKDLNIICSGFCPCPGRAHGGNFLRFVDVSPVSCSEEELSDLGDRLRDWFQLLHGNNKRNETRSETRRETSREGRSQGSTASALDRSVEPSCRDSISWMFSRLDQDQDRFLSRSELESINLDQYEVCVGNFFRSCDAHRDGRVSWSEWCLCFWRDKPPCLAKLERIQKHDAGDSNSLVPSCDEEGYFQKVQCDVGRAECWCVDPQGGELTGSRIQGTPDCGEAPNTSTPLSWSQTLLSRNSQLLSRDSQLLSRNSQLLSRDSQLLSRDSQLLSRDSQLLSRDSQLLSRDSQLLSRDSQLLSRDSQLLSRDSQLLSRDSQLLSRDSQLLSRDSQLLSRDSQLLSRDSQLLSRDSQLLSRDSQLLNEVVGHSGDFGSGVGGWEDEEETQDAAEEEEEEDEESEADDGGYIW
uniref:Uncharacterized protein n=1 Tax=Knipowitschia caucasica TaxID=637954 RepID=A0AAV2LJ96_KNICA